MRTSGFILALLFLAATGCDRRPPPSVAVIDWTYDFSGVWYGTVSTDGGPPEKTAVTIRVDGTNRLLLPGPGTLVASADIVSPGTFTVRTSPLVLDGGSPASITGGWGSLYWSSVAGSSLSYVVRARRNTGDPGVQSEVTAAFELVRFLPPPAPASLTAIFTDEYRSTVRLAWTSSGENVWYSAEYRVDSGEWQQLPWRPTTTSLEVEAPLAPELAVVAFRVRAFDLHRTSDFGPAATLAWPPAGPHGLTFVMEGDAVRLTWSSSQKAETTELERGVLDPATHEVATWEPLATLPITRETYLDATAAEGTDYAYRMTLAVGTNRSWPAQAHFTPPIRVPLDLRASPGCKKVVLAWTNRSSAATGLVILRGQGADSSNLMQPIAQLPATATSYEDLSAGAAWYTYALEVQAADDSARTGPVTVLTLPDPTNLSLVSSLPDLPEAAFARRTSTGGWVLGGEDLWWEPVLYVFADDAWATLVPSGDTQWAQPYFLLDARDRPQLVFVQRSGPNGQAFDIVHGWTDETGQVLQTEKIATRVLARANASSLAFAVDGAGGMHVVWASEPSGSDPDFEYATNATGTWKVEALPDTGLTSYSTAALRLCVDPQGGLHAVVDQFSKLLLAERPAGGDWTWEQVSTGDGSGGQAFYKGETAQCACPAASDFRVFFGLTASSNSAYETVLAHKSNGAWMAPQIIATQPNHGTPGLRVAVRPDGLRQAVRVSSADGVMLYVDDGAGWKPTLVGPISGPEPSLGFKPDGSLYLLEHGPGSPIHWVLYEEQ
ncbi:MAG TPA: fibronectin type III domain-containing protein [Myxococcales bacterium]